MRKRIIYTPCKKYFVSLFLMFFSLFNILITRSCGSPIHSTEQKGMTLWDRLNPIEKKQWAPNELFQFIIQNDHKNVVDSFKKNPSYLELKNEIRQETPLGLALYLGHEELSEMLLDHTPIEHFFELNNQGDSYVLLAAKVGFSNFINKISQRYWESLSGLSPYDFSKLDIPNNKGQKAIHVAKNRFVIFALQMQYQKSQWVKPGWWFTTPRDLKGHNFIHQAVLDHRRDVILWANHIFCKQETNLEEDSSLAQAYTYLTSRVKRGFQTYVGDFGLELDNPFNQKNNFNQTPLHLAAIAKNRVIVEALLSCVWLDHHLEDDEGNYPVHTFLNTMDIYRPIDEGELNILKQLISSETKMRLFFKTPLSIVTHKNNKGDTPLHISMRLQDKRAYNYLKELSNTQSLNFDGVGAWWRN